MKHGLFAELKRRHVYRVAVAYIVVGWLVIQAAATVSPFLHLPDTLTTIVIVVIALGFPVALILAWAFEMTPEGVRRTESHDSPEARDADQHRKVGHTLDRVIIGVLLIAIALLITNTYVWHKAPGHSEVASTAPGKSIAVLPFENLSNDKTNGYFSDGIQDLILTKLADIGDLAVISRTSTMKYGSHPGNLQEIGKQLGVATILEGSVQKAGDQVLINVQLIDARNDHHIWAESYTRTLTNVFSVEGEVASKIASTLNAKLSPKETKRLATTLSEDAEANDLFLRGEYFANRGNVTYDTAQMKKAMSLFKQAVARAPTFSLARAKLSVEEGQLAWFGGGGSNTASLYADSLEQAREALKLDPNLPEAHLAMGYYNYYGKSDYAAAIDNFNDALALRPNYSDAIASKGFVLRRQGKFDDAVDAFKQALTLDPRNSFLATEMASTYMMAGNFKQSINLCKRALALDPNATNAQSNYAQSVLYSTGDVSRALELMRGNNPVLVTNRVSMLIDTGRFTQALAQLQSLPATPASFGGPTNRDWYLGYVYSKLGDKAKARKVFARLLPESRASYAALKGSPLINQASGLLYVAMAEVGLGKTAMGLADIAKAVSIAEQSHDHAYKPMIMLYGAKGYAFAGRTDKAVHLLSRALAMPGIGSSYAPVMLWIDPIWDPVRKTPGFQALLKKYAKDRPATMPSPAKQ